MNASIACRRPPIPRRRGRLAAVAVAVVSAAAVAAVLPSPAAAAPDTADTSDTPYSASDPVPSFAWLGDPTPYPGGDGSGRANVSPARYGGADRYATSLAIAEEIAYDHGRDLASVVIVSGQDWRDAVIAASLATAVADPTDRSGADGSRRRVNTLGASYNGAVPILLADPRSGLSADAVEFLEWVGVNSAVIVSSTPDGKPAVPSKVDGQLDTIGVNTVRYSAGDHYSTAVAVADAVRDRTSGRLASLPGDEGRGTVFVASGEVFADALVAGPLTGSEKQAHPLLLTRRDSLPDTTRRWVRDRSPGRVVIMGGPAAVSEAVENRIREAAGAGTEIVRIGGRDRFETAALAAEWAAAHYTAAAGFPPDCYSGGSGGKFPLSLAEAGLARADVPYDSFTAAPLLAIRCAPLLLARSGDAGIPDATAAMLDRMREQQGPTGALRLAVLGGQAAVADAAVAAYRTASPPDRTHAARYRYRSDDSVLPATNRWFVDYGQMLDEMEVAFRTSYDGLADVRLPDSWEPHAARRHNYLRHFDTSIIMYPFSDDVWWATSGWFTDEALHVYYGNGWPQIDVAWAKRNVNMNSWNMLTFGADFPAGGFGWENGGTWWANTTLDSRLGRLLARQGWRSNGPEADIKYVGHAGWNHRVKPIAAGENEGSTWSWAYAVQQYPPLRGGEPPAWSLYDTTGNDWFDHDDRGGAGAAAANILRVCGIRPGDDAWEDLPSYKRNDEKGSLAGLALRNLYCGEPGLRRP